MRGAPNAAAAPVPAVRAAPRGETAPGAPAGRRSSALIPPVSSTRPCCSTSRRKFCLCSRTPDSASTVRCNCSKVKDGGISSNTTGRYLILPRSRPIAVARMRRWSAAIGTPETGPSVRRDRAAETAPRLRRSAPPRRAARSGRAPVPHSSAAAKASPSRSSAHPLLGLASGALRAHLREPLFERRQCCRLAVAPVLPREIAIPALPLGRSGTPRPRLAHQGQIGDGQGPAWPGVVAFDPVAVAEGIKLLDIAELLAGLALDPCAQPDFESAVLDLERAGGQGLDGSCPIRTASIARFVDCRGDDDCVSRIDSDAPRPTGAGAGGALETVALAIPLSMRADTPVNAAASYHIGALNARRSVRLTCSVRMYFSSRARQRAVADRVLALLKGGEIGFDPARVAIALQRRQYLLRGSDRGAVGLRRIDAEAKAHRLQFGRRHHRRLAALEDVDQRRPGDPARDDLQFFDILRRLDKADIGAGFEIGVYPVDRGVQPLDARASERAMMTRSGSCRVSTAALILPTISPTEITSLPS